jgi:D-sedoheptulose 7-phosphate isomerase
MKLASSLQTPLKAVNLCTHAALSTAFANDVNPEFIYAQLALAYASTEDVLIGISTSGNANNVLAAAITAKAMGSFTIGLTGSGGGKMNGIFDLIIKVPENETFRIQELHLPIYHAICLEVEDAFFTI